MQELKNKNSGYENTINIYKTHLLLRNVIY